MNWMDAAKAGIVSAAVVGSAGLTPVDAENLDLKDPVYDAAYNSLDALGEAFDANREAYESAEIAEPIEEPLYSDVEPYEPGSGFFG